MLKLGKGSLADFLSPPASPPKFLTPLAAACGGCSLCKQSEGGGKVRGDIDWLGNKQCPRRVPNNFSKAPVYKSCRSQLVLGASLKIREKIRAGENAPTCNTFRCKKKTGQHSSRPHIARHLLFLVCLPSSPPPIQKTDL